MREASGDWTTARRRALTALRVLGLALSAFALAAPPSAWKRALDGFAGASGSYFFNEHVCRVLHATALMAGPAVFLVPPLLAAMTRSMRALRAGSIGEEASPDRSPAVHAVAALLVAGLLLHAFARLHADPPTTKDTKFYLGTSLEIADDGGLVTFPARCFSGEYMESNRHPLYPGILSLVAEPSDRFTDRARLLTLAGSIATLLAAMSLARRLFGDSAAMIVGVLIATNSEFLAQSTIVACESWLMALIVLWFGRASCAREDAGLANAAWLGLYAGLLFLLKGTGVAFVIITMASLLFPAARSRFARIAVFALIFAAIGLPLLVRNVSVFGDPFYNINSTRVMWLDSWAQFYDPVTLHRASPSLYFENHGLLEIVATYLLGAFKVGVHLIEDFAPFDPQLGLGLFVLVLALVSLALEPDRRRRWVLVGTLLFFYASFSWYAKIVHSPRFLGVLVPVLFLPAGHALARTVEARAHSRRWMVALAPVSACAAGIALAVAGLAGGALDYRPARFRPDADTEYVHGFLAENVGRRVDLHYVLGPSDRLTRDWDRELRGSRHSFPDDEAAWQKLLGGNYGHLVKYAIVAEPEDHRRAGFERGWYRRGENGLEVADPPEDWTLIESFPADAPRVLVFERRGTVR